MQQDSATSGQVFPAKIVTVRGEHGTVTVFGRIAALTNLRAGETLCPGPTRLNLRYESPSLKAWLDKYDEWFSVDFWQPVTPYVQQQGVLPWMRISVNRMSVLENRADGQGYWCSALAEPNPAMLSRWSVWARETNTPRSVRSNLPWA